MLSKTGWEQCETKTFWKNIAHNDHVVQIYDDESVLLKTLTDYTADGLCCDNSVIIIATAAHITELNKQLTLQGFDLNEFKARDQYIALDAAEVLAQFMVNGLPDERFFLEAIVPVVKRARKSGRQVRAFGEMVALLWESGNSNATIQLEHLWNKFCEAESLCLFCAYPKIGFSQDASASIMHICTAHTKVIGTELSSPSTVQYRSVG